MHFDWVCIFVFVVVFVFFCSFPFLFVSLSLARSLVHSFSQFLFAALFVALAPVSPCQFGQVVACSLAHSPISLPLSLCTRCTLRSLLYLFACSLSRLLRFLALPLLVLLLLRSLNFFCRRQRSLSFRFIPFCLTEWNKWTHTHTISHACMHVHVHAVWQLTLLYLFAYYSFVNFLWLCRRLLWSPNNN